MCRASRNKYMLCAQQALERMLPPVSGVKAEHPHAVLAKPPNACRRSVRAFGRGIRKDHRHEKPRVTAQHTASHPASSSVLCTARTGGPRFCVFGKSQFLPQPAKVIVGNIV